MTQTHRAEPRLAKSADSSALAQGTWSSRRERTLLSRSARPEEVFDRLRQLIEEGRITEARRLTVEAARRFPDHPRVRLAKRVLNDGKATSNPWVQPTATAEIAWLDDPPDEARGKWVALIGGELVGIADSAKKLVESLALKDHRQLPVVQYIAP